MSTNAPRALFYMAAAACIGQAIYQYGRLPPLVASHFGPSGQPNAHMPREGFLGLYVGVVVFVSLVLPLSIRSAKGRPADQLNLPNKDYWLAPERRAETMAAIEGRMFVFGAATYALLFEVFNQVFQFNMGLTPTLDHPLLSLGVYTAFVVVWIALFFRRFSAAPANA